MANQEASEKTDEEFTAFIHEQHRRLALRTFEVVIRDSEIRRVVFAHRHTSNGPSGHLDFLTMDSTGVEWISNSFNVGVWRELHEIHDPTRANAIRALLADLTETGNVKTIAKAWTH